MIALTIALLVLTSMLVVAKIAWNHFFKPNLPRNGFKPLRPSSSAMAPEKVHAYFRNCEKPTTEPVMGQVQGSIPNWLEGTLIRNGPGIRNVGEDVYTHVFEGLAVLHRYHISNGKATYTSRAVESDTYKSNMAASRIVVPEFLAAGFPDPCKSIFQRWHDMHLFCRRVKLLAIGSANMTPKINLCRLQSSFETIVGKRDIPMTDSCGVNVGYYGDQLYAMTETNAIRRIDPENLKIIGDKTIISNYVAVDQTTAHPHILEDGTMYNIGTSFRHRKGPHYVVFKVPPTFESKDTSYEGAKIVAEIPVTNKRYPCYYHSFGITMDKLVFIESPLKVDVLKLVVSNFTKRPFARAMNWDPNLKTRFFVASLTDGEVHPVVYESDSFFTFHHINTYEEDGQIVVDVVGYDKGDFVVQLDRKGFNEGSISTTEATARRFVLPLKVSNTTSKGQNLVTLKDSQAKATLKGESNGKPCVVCEPQHLTKDWTELPRINYLHNAKSYNYFYALSSQKGNNWTTVEPNTLTKVDIKNDKSISWSEEGMIPCEPIFVANPNSKNKDEDDGVVLSALLHENDENRASLLVLDAKNMKELAKVMFQTAGTFTNTFHGQWANQVDKIHLY